MAEILQLQRWQRRDAAPDDATRKRGAGQGAQILLFTGVRYEYLETPQAADDAAHDASQGAQGAGGRG